jgi:hypothetical protein
MVWIAVFIVIASFAVLPALAAKLGRKEQGWRAEAEGFRERWKARNAAR